MRPMAGSGGDAPVTEEVALDRVREAQDDIRRESSMHQIDSLLRTDAYGKLLTEYVRRLISQKRHYLIVWLLLTDRDDVNKMEFWSLMAATNSWRRPERPEGVTELAKIEEFLKRGVRPSTLDELTFGVLPVYMEFFITTMGCVRFSEFMRRLTPDLRLSLSRMVFFSPMFLRFIHRIFRPMIGRRVEARRLVSRWEKHARLCPSVVMRMFRDVSTEEAEQLLSRGFFEVILSRPLATFALCDPHEKPPPARIDELRAFLTFASGQRVLGQLVHHLLSRPAGDGEEVLLGYDDQKDCPELFQRMLFSRLDDNMLSALAADSVTSVTVGGLSLYYRLPRGTQDERTGLLDPERTFYVQTPGAHLRHLLQLCDPIPGGGLRGDLKEKLHNVLVIRGPRSTRIRRVGLWAELSWRPFSPQHVAQWAKGISMERTREIRAISAFTRIDHRSREVHAASLEVLALIERAFIAQQVEAVFPRIMRPRSFSESLWSLFGAGRGPRWYYQNPGALRGEVDFAAKMLQTVLPFADKIEDNRVGEVVFGFFTRDFSFQDFVTARIEFALIDADVEKAAASQNASGWSEQLLIREKPALRAALRAQLVQFVGNQAVANRLRRVFEEPSIFRKLMLWGRVRAELHRHVETALPKEEFGADQWQPCEIAVTLAVRPKRLLANYVYVQNLFGTQSPRYQAFFHDASVGFLAAISGAIQQAIGSVPEHYVSKDEAARWAPDR